MFYSLFYELIANSSVIYDVFDGYLTKFGFIFTVSTTIGLRLVEYAVFYGLRSAAIYKMAKRQNLNHLWLAFIPCACFYLIGLLQDDTTPSARRNIGWLYTAIISSSLWVVTSALVDGFGTVPTLLNILALADTDPVTVDVLVINNTTRLFNLLSGLFSLAFLISSIMLYMNVFRAYAPEKAMKYSIISVAVDILFDTPLFYAIFLFMLRDREKVGYARYAASRANYYRGSYGNYRNPYGNYGGGYDGGKGREERKVEEPFEEFGSNDDDPFTDDSGAPLGGDNTAERNRPNDNGDDLFS